MRMIRGGTVVVTPLVEVAVQNFCWSNGVISSLFQQNYYAKMVHPLTLVCFHCCQVMVCDGGGATNVIGTNSSREVSSLYISLVLSLFYDNFSNGNIN